MNKKYILFALMFLTLSCIYLFYLNYQKTREYIELLNHVNRLKVKQEQTLLSQLKNVILILRQF